MSYFSEAIQVQGLKNIFGQEKEITNKGGNHTGLQDVQRARWQVWWVGTACSPLLRQEAPDLPQGASDLMGETQPCFQELALGLPTSSTLSKLQPFSLPTSIPLKLVSSLLCHPSASCFCMSSLRPADHCSAPGVPSASGSPDSWDFWSRGRDETPARPALQSTQGPAGQPEAGSGLGLKGSRSRPAGHPCLWPDPRVPVFSSVLSCSSAWSPGQPPPAPLPRTASSHSSPSPAEAGGRCQSLQAFSLCLAQLARLS